MPAIEPEPRADRTLSGMIDDAVRDAGDAELVVGRLRDGAGDVRAVAVVVGGVVVVGDEVVAGDELGLGQIADLGDAGVDDGDDRALALAELPGVGHADLAQVPLVAEAGVVRELRGRRARSAAHSASIEVPLAS